MVFTFLIETSLGNAFMTHYNNLNIAYRPYYEVIRDIIAMHVISAQLFVLVKCSSGLTSMVREIDAWYVLGDLMQG